MYQSNGHMSTPSVWIFIVLSLVVLYMIIGIVGATLRARAQHGDYFEDDCWFLGFYNNPDDPHLVVLSPYLRNRTFNIGQAVGMAYMVMALLVFLGLDVLGIVFATR